MQDNAQVCWLENAEPRKVEEALIQELDRPLNLDQNAGYPFAPALNALRRPRRAAAKELPVMIGC